MKGMHVHHRIPVSKGGTNDPSNLFVCSPYFHKNVWHNGEEWIDWAAKGGCKGGSISGKLHAQSGQLSLIAKKSHTDYAGTAQYAERQLLKSLKSHPTKRKHWDLHTYELVRQSYNQQPESGYKIAKKLNISSWKMVSNMLECIMLGFSFDELMDSDKYTRLYLERVKL